MLRSGITALPLAALLLSGCAMLERKAAAPDGALDADEIRELFTEKTVKSVTFSRGTVRETYYMASGELRRLRDDEVSTGSWRVREDGRLCQQVGEHDESCRAVVKAGNTYVKFVVKEDGDHRPIVRYIEFRPGNPRNM